MLPARNNIRLRLPYTLLLLTALASAGCGSEVVTNGPISAEESRELEQQRAMIERQLSRESGGRRQG